MNQKKEFIEKLFNISIFGEMYSAIHRDVLDSDKVINSKQNALIILNRNESDYESRINEFEEKIRLLYVALTRAQERMILLNPIDPLAASCLTLAIQKYGQNERSLFSFLNVNKSLFESE